ncbi:MAG: DegT/DnrJ/EryC1/StrS aminotransferase family protein [Devosia sp.]|nr:DegT/DnrJ/EryC1/StrS aminotransferase family protein [Devosia sp.]
MLLVSEPTLGEDEKAALASVIDSNWITMGGRVQAFEQAFAEKHGATHAVAVNSCTAALHLALIALGIGRGDEVLVPSLSFVATANAVHYAGATPVFVDIESLTVPLISLDDAAAKCTSRTRAVIVMHYAGYIADPDAWRAFADARGLRLIEDSAHAVGSDRSRIFGDLAAFSFFGNKNMTTAEGGMILGEDEDVIARARLGRSHGLTTSTVQRLNGKPMYDMAMLGYNYRMDELSAAIGLVQLAKVDAWNARRRQLTQLYKHLLDDSGVDIVSPFSTQSASTNHIFPILLPLHADRNEVMEALRECGIQTSYHYPPIHQLGWYRTLHPGLTVAKTEEFSARELTLPLHPKMTNLDVENVVESLNRILTYKNGGGSR